MKNLIFFFLIFCSVSWSQADSLSFSYYPLETGNYWEYELQFVSWPNPQYEYSYRSKEILGDTVMPNGLKYKIIESKSIPDTIPASYSFERIDSSTANVYQYYPFGIFATDEYLIDSLEALLNDTCKASRNYPIELEQALTLCYEISIDTINGFGKLTKYFANRSWMPGLSYGLSKEIGLTSWSSVENWQSYGWLKYARVNGIEYGIPVIIKTGRDIIQGYELKQNYPNPFNLETAISFHLPAGASQAGLSAISFVELSIYNLLGQKVKVLVNGQISAGEHKIKWDGRDDAGQDVASGIYVYRLRSIPPLKGGRGDVRSKKMILLR